MPKAQPKSNLTTIDQRILILRGLRVMLSSDIARLYAVQPRALIQAVKRNPTRFPRDFMFQLRPCDMRNLKSQTVISSWGGSRALPYAFTEQGIAMLSSVLHSRRAVLVNIAIMRAFVRHQQTQCKTEELARRLTELEARSTHSFKVVFEAIQELIEPRAKPTPRIGFDTSHPA